MTAAALETQEKPLYLSPSEFAFLYDECHACYWQQTHGLKRPRSIMPSIFNRIDRELKAQLTGHEKWTRVRGLDQAFTIESADKRVTSATLHYPDGRPVALRGNYDTRVRFEDGTFGIFDLKTSHVKIDLVPKYSRQLHSYKRCIEEPAQGEPLKIEQLGLLVWEPDRFDLSEGTQAGALRGALEYLPVPTDAAAFDAFLCDVSHLLARPEPPPGAIKCAYCAYRLSVEQEVEQKLKLSLETVTAQPRLRIV
jgi:hypothetical protein